MHLCPAQPQPQPLAVRAQAHLNTTGNCMFCTRGLHQYEDWIAKPPAPPPLPGTSRYTQYTWAHVQCCKGPRFWARDPPLGSSDSDSDASLLDSPTARPALDDIYEDGTDDDGGDGDDAPEDDEDARSSDGGAGESNSGGERGGDAGVKNDASDPAIGGALSENPVGRIPFDTLSDDVLRAVYPGLTAFDIHAAQMHVGKLSQPKLFTTYCSYLLSVMAAPGVPMDSRGGRGAVWSWRRCRTCCGAYAYIYCQISNCSGSARGAGFDGGLRHGDADDFVALRAYDMAVRKIEAELRRLRVDVQTMAWISSKPCARPLCVRAVTNGIA